MEKNQNFKLLIIGLIIAMVLLVSQAYLLNQTNEEENTLEVSGKSELNVLADEAEIYLEIVTKNEDVKFVQSENKKISNQVIQALTAKGIAKENIETTDYRINDFYDYDYYYRSSNVATDNKNDDQKRTLKYKAVHTLKVKVSDLSIVGELVDLAIASGANNVDSINYVLSDEKQAQIRREALDKAIEVGSEKANFMADKIGVKILEVKDIQEQNYYYRAFSESNLKLSGSVQEDASLSSNYLAPKKVSVQSSVNLVFKIE